jgi:hypothetical protein
MPKVWSAGVVTNASPLSAAGREDANMIFTIPVCINFPMNNSQQVTHDINHAMHVEASVCTEIDYWPPELSCC